MGWFGKIVGGGIGFMVGGPLGAMAGAALGHTIIDRNSNNLSSQEEAQTQYFVAFMSMLGKMAKADGVVTKDEIEVVNNLLTQGFELEGEALQFARNLFKEAKDSAHSFEDFATNFTQVTENNQEQREFMLDMLFNVAQADGKLHPRELDLLKSAQQIFSLSDSLFTTLQERYFPASMSGKYYAILQCSEQDSDTTIKKQYRKLVSEYHPDKIIAKGLPDEFISFANKKFQEIQEAYDTIKEIRKF
ncbi:co-chaperone DjlA [bacterium]|nr:co-chaperone DjlA [bacterium]